MFKKYLWGILAKLINVVVPVHRKHWVFASDYGNLYRESAKYLFEYMQMNHPDFVCTYIVANRNTFHEISAKGYPVALNFSLKGIIAIAKADAVFTTQTAHDMLYVYKKKGRCYFYLNHGQSLKKQMAALSGEFRSSIGGKKNIAFRRLLNSFFISGFSIKDSEFVSANSEFFIPFLKLSYGDAMPIKILGMPRNDALFRKEEMNKEKWIDDLQGKFVITYMPTHRKYGKGEPTPTPFIDRPEIQHWMRQNRCVLLMKQHPNMIAKSDAKRSSDVIMDITKLGLDPQVIIYHSDVLISDYSSVWLDYLLLRRPLITYIYDDFEKNDAGLNIDIKKDSPGQLVYSEDELFKTIQTIFTNYNDMKPSDEILHKFYKDPDGLASKRYYEEICAKMYQ